MTAPFTANDKQTNGKLDLFGPKTILPRIDQNDIIQSGQVTRVTAPKEFVAQFRLGDQTPSVKNSDTWIFKNTSPTNVSYFQGGQPGQTIHILGDGFTTLIHRPGSIFIPSSVNLLLLDSVCYSFKLFKLPNGYQWSKVD